MNLQVKIGDQTFDVEVGDLSARPILATVEGETFEVWPEEAAPATRPAAAVVSAPTHTPAPTPAPASRPVAAAPAVTAENKSKVMLAPIPGAIVSVSVRPGDKVTKGQELIGLEAMKMKNAIRAARDGSIAAVLVNVGDHVQKGHPLVEFTD